MTSTILITAFGLSAATGQLAITAQSNGTFTVSATAPMGINQGGVVTGINAGQLFSGRPAIFIG